MHRFAPLTAFRRLARLAVPGLLLAAGPLGGCAEGPAEDDHGDMTEAAVTSAFEQAFRDKDDAKADGSGCSGVRIPDRGPFGKRIALTFDDGPNPATTPDVIATLRRQQVPATFFINGVRVKGEAEKAILTDVLADPEFMVANHTWSHVNMAEQSADEVNRQIDRTAAILTELSAPQKFFRFPFGSSSCATAQNVRDRGMTIVGWHVDSADWCFAAGGGVCKASTFRYVPDAFRQDMKGYVLAQVRANGGGVVLFHDIHRNTADHLEDIITSLKAEGFTFTRIDDLDTFPKLNGTSAPNTQNPANSSPPEKFIGDVCATDADCAFTAGNATGKCHAAGFCSIPCEGFCPDKTGKAPTFCVQDPFQSTPAGVCVPQSVSQNGHCADLTGTVDASADRYIGASTATARSAEVCMPVVH